MFFDMWDNILRPSHANSMKGIESCQTNPRRRSRSRKRGSARSPSEMVWIQQKLYPGFTRETLKDYRYFTIDSEADLEKKWPLLLNQRPDFIKTHLWFSDEHEKRK